MTERTGFENLLRASVIAALVTGASAAHAQPVPLPRPPHPAAPPGLPAPPSPPGVPPLPPPPPGPPPGYEVAPPPGPAPPYYAPPAATPAATAPPPVLPVYDPDQPVPQGYRLQSRPTVGLLGMGIGLFSTGWVTAVVMGIAFGEEAKDDPNGPDASNFIPLYFPVAGPFVTMAVLKPGPAELGLLLADGVFQIAGSVGILVGSLKRSYRLIYTGETASVEVLPAAGAGYFGLQTMGHF